MLENDIFVPAYAVETKKSSSSIQSSLQHEIEISPIGIVIRKRFT